MSFLNILFADEKVYTQWYDMPKSRYDNINRDINLDKIAEHISANRPDFPTQFLLYPCADKTTALMRIEVFRELYEKESVCIDLSEITKLLSRLGKCKASESNSGCVEQKWMYFLKTAEIYIECIQKLSDILSALKAGAFRKFYSLLQVIQDSTEFQRMVADTNRLSETFSSILNLSLSVDYNSKSIIVTEHIANSLYEELQALCEDILGLTMYRTFSVVNSNPLSALEEDIIKVLKRRHSDAFKELAEFYEHYSGINVYDIVNLKNQIIFYIEFIEFVKKAEAAGMKLTLPDFTDKAFEGKGLYDLSLALKIPEVIPNDFCFGKGELFVLSGPNQGGKTTFVRGLAQSIILAQNGCFVPSETFRTPYFDQLFTHFNREETLGHGRLEEELERIEEILPLLTEYSFVLFNECFTSTRRVDAVKLSLNLLNRLFAIGCSGGFVTHYYEIPEHDGRLISLVAGVLSGSDVRTYKITRQPPSGTAYARTIALQCGVTFDQLKEFIVAERGMEREEP